MQSSLLQSCAAINWGTARYPPHHLRQRKWGLRKGDGCIEVQVIVCLNSFYSKRSQLLGLVVQKDNLHQKARPPHKSLQSSHHPGGLRSLPWRPRLFSYPASSFPLRPQLLEVFPYESIIKWLPSHKRSSNRGTPECLDIQIETHKGPKDLRMRCGSPEAVVEVINQLRNTVQTLMDELTVSRQG